MSEPVQVDFATVLDWVEGRLDPPDRVERLRVDSGDLVLVVQLDVGWSRS